MSNRNDQNTSTQNQRTNSDETTLQQEVDLPTPEKKNDEITTGERLTENESNTQQGDNNRTQKAETGFDVNQKRPEKNDESQRGDTTEKERREREDNPEKAEFQDAGWQRDKMNEANNEDTRRNPKDEQITKDTKAERTTDNKDERNSSNTGQDEKTTEDGRDKTIKDVNNPQDRKEQHKDRENQNRIQNDQGPIKDQQRKDQEKKKYTA